MRTVADWVERVLRDFRNTPAARTVVEVIDFDPARLGELESVLPDPVSWIDPSSPDAHRLLLRIDGNVTSLDDAAGPSTVALEVASSLQDYVVDQLNRPWPEVVGRDGTPVVMEPRIGSDGTPQWAGRGLVCDFGELHRHPSA